MSTHGFALRAVTLALVLTSFAVAAGARQATTNGDPEAAKIKNPIASTPESIEAGKRAYQTYCGSCHGADAKGGITISVIEDRGGKQPPDLTDAQWDHGSSDGEIAAVIKKGVPPDFFMAPWDGRIKDDEIWDIVNFIKSAAATKK
jgi:mono/diheme cytochrome c family protein